MKKEISLRLDVKVKIPMTPNFIQMAEASVHIRDIDEATLRQIGREWTEQLVARSKKARQFK